MRKRGKQLAILPLSTCFGLSLFSNELSCARQNVHVEIDDVPTQQSPSGPSLMQRSK